MFRYGKLLGRPVLRSTTLAPLRLSRPALLPTIRHARSSVASRPYSTPIGQIDKPTYQLTFTCKACTDRSSHLVSKQAYHKGTVLIQCPGCKNRHLIADHLNVFGKGKMTLEDILKEKGSGEKITHSVLDMNKIADIEWEDPNTPPTVFPIEEKKQD